jgi:hypothetical protein
MDLELVAAFSSLVEAQIACSALRSAGVAAQVMDQNFSSILPAAPIGGFRVGAPIGEGARAKQLLKNLSQSGEE